MAGMDITYGSSIEITHRLDRESAGRIAQWIGGYTVIRNQKCLEGQSQYRAWLEAGSPGDARPQPDAKVAHIARRTEFPFLLEIPSQIRRNAGAKWLEQLNAALVGLRKTPKVKPKHRKRNCYVTNELFEVARLDKDLSLIHLKTSANKGAKRFIGIPVPFPVEAISKSFYLSRQGDRFWLSLSHAEQIPVPTEKELRQMLHRMTREALAQITVGNDVGVVRQISDSEGRLFHYSPEQVRRLEELERKRIRHQRRYSRITRANDRNQKTPKRKRTNGEKRQAKKWPPLITRPPTCATTTRTTSPRPSRK